MGDISNGVLDGDRSLFQISLYSDEPRFVRIPSDAINVPSGSDPEQLNLLVNESARRVDDTWTDTMFDFLIDGTLLRTNLSQFATDYNVSPESIIKIECIEKKAPPHPYADLSDSDWVSDLKALSLSRIFSTNYAGELVLWSGTNSLDRECAIKLEDGPLKCLDAYELNSEVYLIVGGQDQMLYWIKYDKKSEFSKLSLFRGHQRSVECIAANCEVKRAVSGSFDKRLKVWKLEMDDENNFTSPDDSKNATIIKTPMVTLETHKEAIVGVKWHPLNNAQVATVSWDSTIILWDLETAGPCETLSSNKAFTSLSFSNLCGRVITGSTDPVIRLWDFRSHEGSMVKSTFMGHRGWVSSVCWSPQENLFTSASFDGTVKMWDIRSPKAALYDLMGHRDRVLAVNWSVEKLVCSGAADCKLLFYNFIN